MSSDVRDPFVRPRNKLTDEQREQALLALLRNDHYAIENALLTYARNMEKAAVEARAGFEAGQADPDVKAHQDGTILPNNGMRQAADALYESAQRARRVAGEIEWLTDEYAHDPDSDET